MTETRNDKHNGPLKQADISAAAELGAQAKGAEIVTIAPPAGIPGLPASVPAILYRGAEPSIAGVASIFEPYRLHPERKRGTAAMKTLESFIDIVRRHKSDHSAVFADIDWRAPALTAVIDYHPERGLGVADFCQHLIHYDFPLSEEWQAWTKANGEKMTQAEFAYFLEDRIAELAAPTAEENSALSADFATTVAAPTELVQLSRGLQVNVEARVKSSTVLASGEGSIVFEETHQDADGKPLRVPGMFMLQLPPFTDGEPIRTPVRLRYRAKSGQIVWFYEIYRPDLFIANAVNSAIETVRHACELPVFAGDFEKP
jgi:uncharacterized protein YfdQ (DUF2303 family)